MRKAGRIAASFRRFPQTEKSFARLRLRNFKRQKLSAQTAAAQGGMEQKTPKAACQCGPEVASVHEMCEACTAEYVQWQTENEESMKYYAALIRGRAPRQFHRAGINWNLWRFEPVPSHLLPATQPDTWPD
jgi:hypothetical protein